MWVCMRVHVGLYEGTCGYVGMHEGTCGYVGTCG